MWNTIRHWLAKLLIKLYKTLSMPNNIITSQHFQFDFGGSRIDCLEVTGLDFQRAIVEIRDGSSPSQLSQKVPGLIRFYHITVRRAVQKNDLEWYEWWLAGQQPDGQQVFRDVRISLLDETHQPLITWRLQKALPARVSYSALTASSSEALTEEIELAFEQMTVQMN
jgi:phage tail-like protein